MNKKEEIYQVISKADHPLLVKELLRLLNLHREDRQELKPLLRRMVREGQIVRLRGRRYGLPQKMDLVPGQFKGHREGYGFVIPDPDSAESYGKTDVYIGSRKNHGAMHGDRVVARVERHQTGERREGRIIRILEREHTELVGRFESGRHFGFLIPSDRRIVHGLCISPEKSQGAHDGDIVIAEILAYPTKEHPAEGKVLKIIGRPEDTEIDTEIVIASNGLRHHFSEEVLAAAQISESIPSKKCEGRVDLINLPTVTIDGEQARDFDDALSIEARDDGYRLWVHIADVADYIEEDGLLDQEAFLRGTSVYFPDRVLPMFPEKISNGICSLKPEENRLALSIEMDFGLEGKLLSHRIYESIIQSDERMTYTNVRQILEDEEDTAIRKQYRRLLPQFEAMAALAKQLRRRRLKRGSLDFDLPEPAIILSPTGRIIDITREERNVAHRLIEEFMLAANETVARDLTRKGIPSLYRIHESPPEDRVATMSEMIQQFDLKPRIGKKITPKNISEILEAVKGRPEEKLINQVFLRSMQRARYSAENRGHFGLASEEYTHFTSPIRRYPDLIVHRILKQTLRSRFSDPARFSDLEKEKWTQKLAKIAQHCSARERIAVDAERDVIQRKQVKFMADKLGIHYKGMITGLAAYGFFVQLEHYFVEGLVHVSSLDDDYYIFDEKQHTLTGRSRQRTYRLGQSVRIIVDRVDLENQKIDFKVVKGRRQGKGMVPE